MDDPPEDYEPPFTPYSVQPQTPMDQQRFSFLFIVQNTLLRFIFNTAACMEDNMGSTMKMFHYIMILDQVIPWNMNRILAQYRI